MNPVIILYHSSKFKTHSNFNYVINIKLHTVGAGVGLSVGTGVGESVGDGVGESYIIIQCIIS